MKKIVYLILFSASFTNAQTINDSIKGIVRSQLEINLSKIPIGSENKYGFNAREDFAVCNVGEPLLVLTLNAEQELIEINEWRIPIVLKGNYKILFTVKKNNKKFEIVDIGGVDLAKEIQQIRRNNNPSNFLIRLINLHIDFIANNYDVKSKHALVLIPMQSSKQFLGSKSIFADKTILTFNDLTKINKLDHE